MPAFCPLCASDDHTSQGKTPDGIAFAVCHDPSHGADGYVWEPWVPKRSLRSDGIGAELDIWDKLLECVPDDGAFHSYGDIEEALFGRYPAEATVLLHRYGHKLRDPAHPSNQYSMSAYLGSRLRELHDEGLLDLAWEPATGSWAHNGVISHWKKR